MTKRIASYARVSTAGQNCNNQLYELGSVAERNGWVIVREYIDHGMSGTNGRDKHPEFDKMVQAANRKEFDLIAAWSVNRLGRSLQHLVSFLAEIQSKKIGLYLHQQALDTTTPTGMALFQICGVSSQHPLGGYT